MAPVGGVSRHHKSGLRQGNEVRRVHPWNAGRSCPEWRRWQAGLVDCDVSRERGVVSHKLTLVEAAPIKG